MVSKVAVIALVAIVACPILLGYAMNLNETTVTEYKSNNDPMNVTQLLQTGTDWSIAQADPYQLNSNVKANILTGQEYPSYPVYNKVSTVKTSLPMVQGTANAASGTYSMTGYEVYEVWCDYIAENGTNLSVSFRYNNGNNSTSTQTDVIFIGYYANTEKVRVISSSRYYDSNHLSVAEYSVPDITSITYTVTNPPVKQYYHFIFSSGMSTFADFSEGYYFQKYSNKPTNWGWNVSLPENTMSVLLSINLDSITDSDYIFRLEQVSSSSTSIQIAKTTTGGVVSWKLYKAYNDIPSSSTIQELYYNPDISDNTYQVLLTDTTNDGTTHEGHMQFRYIGHWQKPIGEAIYYQTYDIDYDHFGTGNVLDGITIAANDTYTSRTPTIRLDAAKFRAYEYPVIQGTLDPTAFKSNPATKISNVEQYGTQLIFGGNTYNVTDGNITMGTHQIPIRNMVLDSVPNADTLQYDNRINGTVVSSTANPSTIQFVGNWSANVSITSMDQTSYTTTEWVAGSFGWDGLDHNFLIVGLLTSFGAFIALGIYMRRTKASLWPLLIVCGGAAVLFFIML